MTLSLLERLEQQGGSTPWRGGGFTASLRLGGRVESGLEGHPQGRWFFESDHDGQRASSSGRLRTTSKLIAERTDDGVFVAPVRPGTAERIVWVGDLELMEVGSPAEGERSDRLRSPQFELHHDGMGLDLCWEFSDRRRYGGVTPGRGSARGGEMSQAPMGFEMRLSLPCRPTGEVTFTNEQLDPEVWLSATRAGQMAARMRPYAALPELEVATSAGGMEFEASPQWRLGLSVMDPDGRLRSEDRFSPGTFRWTVPSGSRKLSLTIRMISDQPRPRAQRGGELGSLLARGSSQPKSPPESPPRRAIPASPRADSSASASEILDRALVLPGDVIRRGLSRHAAASELRQLLLEASPFVEGARFDVALWAARAAFLLAPSREGDVTSVTLPFLLRVTARISQEADAHGCPGAAAAGLPRWCSRSNVAPGGGVSVEPDQIPIELAALLHQAVLHTSHLAASAGNGAAAGRARQLGRRLRRWFQDEFWLARPDRPRDLGSTGNDAGPAWNDLRGLCLRPHMLLAAAFAGSPLSRAQRGSIVKIAESRLLVPHLGFATLDHDDLEFDGYSPENGAVWPFLIGSFVEASLRAFGEDRGRRRLLTELTRTPLQDAPMAWAHSGVRGVSPAPFLSTASDSHPMPLGPLKYAVNLAESARAKQLLNSEWR